MSITRIFGNGADNADLPSAREACDTWDMACNLATSYPKNLAVQKIANDAFRKLNLDPALPLPIIAPGIH